MQWIFLTTEGETFSPNAECIMPDVENAQVIGRASGETAEAAFNRLQDENEWLMETGFSAVFCYPLGEQAETRRTEFVLGEQRHAPV